MLQDDVQFTNAMRQAILLRKRDWLTNLVQTAADVGTANLDEQIVHSVVDWLVDLFS